MEEINGFKIIERTKRNYCHAICKECGKKWETNIYTLAKKISCGCISWKQLRPLPKYINGFKVIEDYAYTKVKNVRRALVECKVCKRVYEVAANALKDRKHCGCMKKDVIACKYAKSHPQLAQSYKHMMSRCYDEKNKDYYNYGARRIRVCKEWKRDRNIFCEWALKNGFENGKGLSLDRIDYNKGYNPENCRWATITQQARNTRRNVLTMEAARELRKDRQSMKLKDLSKKYKVSMSTIYLVLSNQIWKEE